jgi:hypothetical protein
MHGHKWLLTFIVVVAALGVTYWLWPASLVQHLPPPLAGSAPAPANGPSSRHAWCMTNIGRCGPELTRAPEGSSCACRLLNGLTQLGQIVTTIPAITVDDALQTLRAGNVAFNTPEKARVGKQFIVEAKLSTHLHREEMEVLIEEPGKREVATLKVSDRMAATLTGGSAFEVSPSGPQEQWISDKEPTEWHWQVTPKSAGEQILILSFDAKISLNGKENSRTINTFKRHISIDVGWPETVGEWLDLIKKTGENVSWIWATLLIPIGGSIWAWIKHRARPPDQSGSI